MTTTHPTLGEARLPSNPLLSEVLELVSKQKNQPQSPNQKVMINQPKVSLGGQ